MVTVDGQSMAPTLPRGTVVLTEACAGASVRVGDVVVFQGDRGLTVHRVVHATGRGPRSRLFHVGDALGGVGIGRVADVVARAAAVLSPGDGPIPGVAEMPWRWRLRFADLRLRCRLAAWADAATGGRFRQASFARWAWRRLLG